MADRVFAPHYAVPARRTVGRVAALLAAADGPVLSQLLPGEPFDVLEFTSTAAWGRSPVDGAVGFVARDALTVEFVTSHIVVAKSASVRPAPSNDRDALATLPMGARVAATAVGDDWFEVDGGYVAATALASLDLPPVDPVEVAMRLKNVPVVAGGRSGDGVDAAGLVFLSHMIAGDTLPRFADLQAESIGTALAAGDPLRRGDLIFFDGHAAIIVDGDTAIHADGIVRCDPIAALDRFGPITARRRPA